MAGDLEDRNRSTLDDLQGENQRLKRAVKELSVLNRLATEIGSSLDSQTILERIVNNSIRAVHGEQGVLALVPPRGERPTKKTLVRVMYSSHSEIRYELSDAVIGWMHLNKRPLLVNSPRTDERFRNEQWDERIASLLSVPLIIKSQLTGILTVYNKKKEQKFNEDDQRLLAILASQSAQVIENARLYEEEKELIKLQVEYNAAARIQEHLLPATAPEIPGYELAGKSLAARNVGGDFFDFIRVDEGQWAICLGDVAGKGLPAALLMANLQATIREQTLRRTPIRECLMRSNSSLYRSTDPERYATVFCGILDVNQQTFRFTNAGHVYPLLFSSGGDVISLRTGGPPIGLLEDCWHDEEELPFQPGDLLLIFSDGLIDAVNEAEEHFGAERLRRTVEENRTLSAEELVEKIIRSVDLHSGSCSQLDDITLVTVKSIAT
jgi:sigma-B regulation protein RsbU (phosphoserine phosphatase)